MPEGLILEFYGFGRETYEAVNDRLGIEVDGTGNWPDGLLVHVGAEKEAGGFLVFEVWESKAAQQAFMDERLGAALQAAGVGPPARAEWLAVAGLASR